MSIKNENSEPVAQQTIWDFPLRLFHWLLVCAVFVAAITGYFFEEWWLKVHAYAGYGVGALLSFRLIWGLTGSRYSQFRTFPLRIDDAYRQVRQLIHGKSDASVGHNPIAAWMIVTLLSLLGLVVITGFVAWGGQENQGPFAAFIGHRIGKVGEEVHEFFSHLLMLAIGVHLLGVAVETFVFKQPVIRAMISGKKLLPSGQPRVGPMKTYGGLAVFAFVMIAWFYWLYPSQSQKPVHVSQLYQQECGDCHHAFHPSLRTRSTWASMLETLDDHFGEDASLEGETKAEIARYLLANSASAFDTEAANEIGRHDTSSLRVTDTPFWQLRHKRFSAEDYSHPSVGSKINCNACHLDAGAGRYDDSRIQLPKGIRS